MNQLGLIGYPLSHSFSAAYFASKFQNENIKNWKYFNFEMSNISEILMLVSNNQGLVGFNVTIPYKEHILNFLDEIDEEAKEIGAVNTVKIFREKNKIYLKGFNTDIYGFEKSLLPLLESHHKDALILGTGGAAKAVAYVLRKLNINYKFVSRNLELKDFYLYSDITEDVLKKYKLIINTTPLGTFPNVLEFPQIPYFALNQSHILFDLVYNPAETRFLHFGRKYGAKCKNGYEMLVNQAEKAWTLFQI